MKWAAFKFLTDENIQTPVVEYLQTKGFDILDVKQNGLSGSSDTYLLSLAYQQQRIVLTHDSDFGTLAFANHQPFWGIIYLKPGHILPSFTISSLNSLMQLEDLTPPFIVTAKNSNGVVKIRVRLL